MRSTHYGGQGRHASLNPCGYTTVTLDSSVATLVPPAPNIERVILRTSGGAARFRDDSLDPTSTVGFPVLQDEGMILDSAFTDLRFTKDSTAVATVTLHCLWYN